MLFSTSKMSARDRPLSKKEQEEEEMRNELAEYGVQDDHIPADEMKQLLDVLKKSKESSFVDSPSTSTQETRSSNNSETYSSLKQISAPSYSYRNSLINDNGVSTLPQEQLKENSPEREYKKSNSPLEINSQEKELAQEKNYNLNNDFPPLRNQSSFKNSLDSEPPKQWARESKKAAAALKRMRIERYKLNPYQFEQNKDAEPLKSSEQLDDSSNTLPFIEDLDSEKFQELYNEMSKKLDTLHATFCSSEMTTGDSNSQWGPPIKVAKKWNGTLDKNPVVEKIQNSNNHSPSEQISNTCSPNHETTGHFDTDSTPADPDLDKNTSNLGIQGRSTRATKRKALQNINYAKDADYYNSEDEFADSKKRKTSINKKTEDNDSKLQKEQRKDPDFEVIDIDKDNSDDELFDNSNLHSIRKNKKQVSTDVKKTEGDASYPRKVLPPNPNKRNFKGPKSAKKKGTSTTNNALKKKMGINDEEITKTLDDITACVDDNDVEITNEIKPQPLKKINNKKLQNASTFLENKHKNEEKKIKAEEDEKKRKELEERLEKDRIIGERLQKIEDEEAKKLAKENHRKEQEELYSSMFKKQITNPNTEKFKTAEEIDEDILLADENEPRTTNKIIGNQNSSCPICQKSFPSDKIESHASECDAFSEFDDLSNHRPSTSRRNSDAYECIRCNQFQTYDGNHFEEHWSSCKERSPDKKNGGYYQKKDY